MTYITRGVTSRCMTKQMRGAVHTRRSPRPDAVSGTGKSPVRVPRTWSGRIGSVSQPIGGCPARRCGWTSSICHCHNSSHHQLLAPLHLHLEWGGVQAVAARAQRRLELRGPDVPAAAAAAAATAAAVTNSALENVAAAAHTRYTRIPVPML